MRNRIEESLHDLIVLLGPSTFLKLSGEKLFSLSRSEAKTNASRAKRLDKLGEKLIDLALIHRDLD